MSGVQAFYAFWEYHDGYLATYLHGEVTHMHDDGSVQVKGYGTCRFRPVRLLPLAAGIALGAAIDAAYAESRRAVSEAKAQANQAIQAAFAGSTETAP